MDPFSLLVIAVPLVFMALFLLPALRLKRALYQVIDRFRGLDSACLAGIGSLEELGLRPPGLLDGLFPHKDFRPYALQVLIMENVVQLTGDKGLCLREERVGGFMQKYRL